MNGNGNGRADWAEAAQRLTGFLAGCRDYGQSAELAADLAALRDYGVSRHPVWRSRVSSAEQALGAMRQFEAERFRRAEAFLAAHRPEPLLKRGEGRGIGGWTSPAERARREKNLAARKIRDEEVMAALKAAGSRNDDTNRRRGGKRHAA